MPSRAAEVTEGKQHSLLVWDGPDGPELRTFDPSTGDLGTPIRPGPINAFSVSGSGHRVVVGSALEDGGVEVYDGDTGELLAQLGDGARAGYLTPADQLFVTSFGGELTLHDLDTLEVVRTFGGSLGFIQSVVGTIDGDIVAARGGDRSLTLFDVESGVRLGTPLTIPDEAFDLFALAPDGSRLAVSSLDGTLVWELDPERWLDAACRVAGRNLTREEWATNIGDLAPYAATCPELPLDP